MIDDEIIYIKNKVSNIFKKYESSSSRCIFEGHFENIIKEICTEFKLLNAELQAKVYTYEKIIANSNFKAVLETKNKKDNKDIKDTK